METLHRRCSADWLTDSVRGVNADLHPESTVVSQGSPSMPLVHGSVGGVGSTFVPHRPAGGGVPIRVSSPPMAFRTIHVAPSENSVRVPTQRPVVVTYVQSPAAAAAATAAAATPQPTLQTSQPGSPASTWRAHLRRGNSAAVPAATVSRPLAKRCSGPLLPAATCRTLHTIAAPPQSPPQAWQKSPSSPYVSVRSASMSPHRTDALPLSVVAGRRTVAQAAGPPSGLSSAISTARTTPTASPHQLMRSLRRIGSSACASASATPKSMSPSPQKHQVDESPHDRPAEAGGMSATPVFGGVLDRCFDDDRALAQPQSSGSEGQPDEILHSTASMGASSASMGGHSVSCRTAGSRRDQARTRISSPGRGQEYTKISSPGQEQDERARPTKKEEKARSTNEEQAYSYWVSRYEEADRERSEIKAQWDEAQQELDRARRTVANLQQQLEAARSNSTGSSALPSEVQDASSKEADQCNGSLSSCTDLLRRLENENATLRSGLEDLTVHIAMIFGAPPPLVQPPASFPTHESRQTRPSLRERQKPVSQEGNEELQEGNEEPLVFS